MHNLLFTIICILNVVTLQAQFQDNFNDGDFTNNPTWLGTANDFIINTNTELQLNATTGGTAQLYSNVPTVDSTVWEFYIRLEFPPSAGNRLKAYLNANSSDLTATLNGYFIQIGESGNNDAIELRRQDGTSSTVLIRGTDGAVANDPAVARVQVKRDNNGNWQLSADYTGGTNYTLEGTATDNTYPTGDFFGFDCIFTSTRKDKFFLDDVLVSPLFTDNIPPTIQSIVVNNSTEIEVVFNEPVELNSAQNTTNYSVNNSFGNPVTATRNTIDFNTVTLTFNTPFISNQLNELTVSNITDEAGNSMTMETTNFTFVNIEQADPLDIVINEIMADPTPSVGLPDAEFIELYNRSNKVIQLENFGFSSGGTPQLLPNFLLQPNQHIVICDDSKVIDFANFGTTIGVSNFPALTNGGDQLILTNSNGTIIHEVNYELAWYQDIVKDDGGYTLELINPDLTCKGSENWRVSNATNGGTPAQQNTIFNNTPDTQSPIVQDIIQINTTILLLSFDDVLDSISSETLANYTLNNGIGNPTQAILQADLKSVEITFGTAMISETTYTLTLQQVTDCVGNTGTITENFTFLETVAAEQYDILINEIYTDFNPSLGLPELEYIELYNRSNKLINLKNIELSVDGNSSILPDFIFQPDAYIVIYENDVNINFSTFNIPVLPIENLPSLGNTAENITLSDLDNGIIHHVNYTNEWYNNSDKADGGWSLELINPNQICEGKSNWSASINLIGGTPGQVNSILETDLDTQNPDILSAFPITETIIQVTFSETVKALTLSNTAFSIDNGTTIQSVELEEPSFNSVLITLNQPLNSGIIYTITAANQVQDCNGNEMGLSNTVKVALPETLAEKDLIINEILFNPFTGGVDFIEIYNRSSKVLNLADLILANSDGGLINATEPVENNRLIFPEEYIVFTKSPTIIQKQYTVLNPNQLIKNNLPSFTDEEGGVILLSNGTIIDQKLYHEEEHYPLIDNNDGVSLERLNPDGNSDDKNNWHSAAATVGFATPTYQNSQFFKTDNSSTASFELAKTTFSPDGDGFEDVLLMNYNLTEVGYTASIEVYDANGFLIQKIANNELLGLQGNYKWDGTTIERTKARIGIYVILVKLFAPNGQREQFKLTGVLAGQF